MCLLGFPIFDGVGELQTWILWLEDFFVRENFTADEKLNLAQSLLEGEALLWFQWRTRVWGFFDSWEMMNLALLLRFGDDDERIRLRETLTVEKRKVSEKKKETKNDVDLCFGTQTLGVDNNARVNASKEAAVSLAAEHGQFQKIGEGSRNYDSMIDNMRAKVVEKGEKLDAIERKADLLLQSLTGNATVREVDGLSQSGAARSQDRVSQVPISSREPCLSEIRPGIRENLLKNVDMAVFEGLGTYGWIATVERFFKNGGYNDAEKLALVSVSLQGEALDWYNYEFTSSNFENWNQFKSRLLKRFGTPYIRGPSLRLFRIKQDGTVAEYVQKFEDLSSQVTGLGNHKLEIIFMNGLKPVMAELVYKMKPLSLSEMIDFALSMESRTLRKETSKVADTTVTSPREIVSDAEKVHNSDLREVTSVVDHEEFVVKEDLSGEKKSTQREIDSKTFQDNMKMDSVKDLKLCQHRELICETSSVTTLAETNSVPQHTLILPHDSKKVQEHRVELQKLSPVGDRISEQFFANGEVVSSFPTDILQLSSRKVFKHQLIASKDSKSNSFCSRTKVGLVRTMRRVQSLRLKKQAHVSSVVGDMRMKQLLISDMQPMNMILGGADKLVTLDKAHLMLRAEFAEGVTGISATLPVTFQGTNFAVDCGIKAVLEKIIQGDNVWEAYIKMIDKFQLKLKHGLDIRGTSCVNHCRWYSTPVDKSVYFLVWHCWKNKAENSQSISWIVEMVADSRICDVVSKAVVWTSSTQNIQVFSHLEMTEQYKVTGRRVKKRWSPHIVAARLSYLMKFLVEMTTFHGLHFLQQLYLP